MPFQAGKGQRTPAQEKNRQIKHAKTIWARKTRQYEEKITALEAELEKILEEEETK